MKHQSLLPGKIMFWVQIYCHCAIVEMHLSFLDEVITLKSDIRAHV